jgi:hypothetical protein
MAKKTNADAINELRDKARRLQKKADALEQKTLIQLGRILKKHLVENEIQSEKLLAFNQELHQFLMKR